LSYEEFQKRLSDNWLEPKEASVYVILAKSGSLKASELARLCDISRMDAYRILRRLEDKGIVETVMSRPMKFQAIPPDKAFDTLLKSASEKLVSMKSEKNYLVTLWPSQPFPEEGKKDAEKLRIIQGRVEFNNTLRRAVQSAHKEILLITTKNGLSRLFHTGFDKDIEEKTDKGISVRIIAKVSEGETEAVEKFSAITNLRYLNNPINTQIIIIDGLQATLSSALDDSMSLTSEKDTTIWTNSKDQITVLETLFEEIWNHSIDIKTSRVLIERGSPLPLFRRIIGSEKISSLEQDLVNSANSSITLLVRSINRSLLLKESFTKLLMDAKNRGVEIKIITAMKEEDISKVQEMKNQFQLKVTNIEPSIDILVVDQTSFIGLGESDTVPLPSVREVFHIREESFVSLMDRFLYESWEKAENANSVLKSMKWVENLRIILQRAAEKLNEKGYSVETPGLVKGSSSIDYLFDLVVREKNTSKCVIVDHQTSSQKVISFYAQAKDCNVHKAILLADVEHQEDSIKMASFFGINTVKIPISFNSYNIIVDAVLNGFSEN
jgi:sugar-specific transcriptional regulator TrmB